MLVFLFLGVMSGVRGRLGTRGPPPEDVFEFFVHVHIPSVPLTPLLISQLQRPWAFFFLFLIVEVESKPAVAAVIHRDVSEMGS